MFATKPIIDLSAFTPTTLAAMAADLERMDRSVEQDELRHLITETLAENVGDDGAAELIEAQHRAGHAELVAALENLADAADCAPDGHRPVGFIADARAALAKAREVQL